MSKITITQDMVDTLFAMIDMGQGFDQDLAISVFRDRDTHDLESNVNWTKIKTKLKEAGYVWGWVGRNKMGYKKR